MAVHLRSDGRTRRHLVVEETGESLPVQGRVQLRERPENLDPGPERRSSFDLLAAAPKSQMAELGTPRAEGLEQPRLADAGLAAHRDGAHVATVEQHPHFRELLVAAEPRWWRWRVGADGGRAGGGQRGAPRGEGDGLGVLEDVVFQCLQLVTRLQTEMVDDQSPGPAECREGVGLPAGAVESKGQQPPQPLTQRLPAGLGLQVLDHRLRPAEIQPRLGAALDRHQA